MPRVSPADLAARLGRAAVAIAIITTLAACGSTPASSDDGTPSSPGAPATPGPVGGKLGIIPGVEGFAYTRAPGIVPAFVEGVNESIANATEVQVLEAAIASRGDDEVSVIAFGFPGVDDTAAINHLGQVIDGMEDALQVGSERGVGGEGYVLTTEGQTVILAPWARTDFLVFLFFNGPTEATHDIAGAILNAVD
jgi:hypothetical protein